MGKRGFKNGRALLLLFISFTVIGTILYANAMDNSFHYDDNRVILHNDMIQDTAHLPDLWTTGLFVRNNPDGHGHYRPLVLTSYLLNHAVGGLDPVGYHAVDLLLHILMAFLVAQVVDRLTGRLVAGSLAGLLFLVHPFNSEAVNYITARSSQMYALFYLLAFYAYLRYRPPLSQIPTNPPLLKVHPSFWLGVSCLSFVLSILSKEMAVTLPVTLLLYEWLLRPVSCWRDRLHHLWIPGVFTLGVVSIYLAIRKVLTGAALAQPMGHDMVSQLATQSVILIRTLGLILWPAGLTIDHRVKIYNTFATWPVIENCFLLIGILGVILWWGRSEDIRRRVLAFLLTWFFVVLSPLTVINLNAMLQENRVYLAMMGVVGLEAIGLVWVFDWCRTRVPILWRCGWAGTIILVLVYGGLTIQRNIVWQDDLSLWTDAVQKEPDSPVSRDNLGVTYEHLGQVGKAAEQYRAMYLSDPTSAIAALNIGVMGQKQGRYEEAREWFVRSIRLDPGHSLAYFRLGKLEDQQGHWDKAVWAYSQVVRLSPDSVAGRRRLADTLVHVGRIKEAVREYETLLKKGIPDKDVETEVRNNLAGISRDSGG